MTLSLVEMALDGSVTPEMERIGKDEGVSPETVRKRIAEGQIVIPLNTNRPCAPVGIGMGLSTKINASIGTSTDIKETLRVSQKA